MLDGDERCRHVYVIGQTGTGKSTLLLNLIAQDLAAGAAWLCSTRTAISPNWYWPRSRNTAATISFTSIRPTPNGRSASIPSPACPSPQADRRRRRGLGLSSRLARKLGATARLHPVQRRAQPARRAGRHAVDAAAPAHRRSLPRSRRRASCHAIPWCARSGPTSTHVTAKRFRTEAISPIQNKVGKVLMEPRLRNMLAQPKSTITPRRLMDAAPSSSAISPRAGWAKAPRTCWVRC